MKAVIGITGGISTGKSNVSNEIRNLGYKVIDSDEIYRNLSKKGMPICKKIEEKLQDNPEVLQKYVNTNVNNDYVEAEVTYEVLENIGTKEKINI